MSYELFFFDVDGTLLDNKTHSIPKSTFKALRKLKEAGKKIIICTGRGYAGIMEMEALRRLDWDGFVLLNGAVFADHLGKELYRHCMSSELIRKLNQVSEESGYVLSCLGEKEWLNKQPDEYTKKAYGFFHRDAMKFDVSPLDESMTVSMALAFGPEDCEYKQLKEIKELLVLPTRYCYADLNDACINKAVGILEACKAMGMNVDKTMAFGDGINDLEMIEAAGIGVAMGQGHPAVKAAADYITDPVDQNGIWNALVHFGIIDEN